MKELINQKEILENVKEIFKRKNCGFHGITSTDKKEFENLLMSVKENDTKNKTEFPDFISENGFVEHFHVTSGKSTRKGYDTTTQESKMQKSHESFMKNFSEKTLETNNNDEPCESQSETAFLRENDSLENFHKSFKRCWENHIEHLHNYKGNKHLSCFLVSSDDVFEIYEIVQREEGMLFGDLENKEPIKFCLSYDFELLDYMYKYRDDIDYVIYYNKHRNYFELLKIKNIPAIKQVLSERIYEIRSLVTMESLNTYRICKTVNNK